MRLRGISGVDGMVVVESELRKVGFLPFISSRLETTKEWCGQGVNLT